MGGQQQTTKQLYDSLQLVSRRQPLGGPCDPPEGTENGSRHLLQPPHQIGTRTFIWVAACRTWECSGFGRWPSVYMGGHGWKYVGPATAAASSLPKPRRRKSAA